MHSFTLRIAGFCFLIFLLANTGVWAQENLPVQSEAIEVRKALPVDSDNPTVAVTAPASISGVNTVPLDERERKKIQKQIDRSRMTPEQRKKEKQRLNRAPALQDKYWPHVTERESIPKRF